LELPADAFIGGGSGEMHCLLNQLNQRWQPVRHAAGDLRIAEGRADIGPSPFAIRFVVFQYVVKMNVDRLCSACAGQQIGEADIRFFIQSVSLRARSILSSL